MSTPFGLTTNLVASALVCAALAYLLFLRGRLAPATALIVLLVKFSLPVVYFAWFFDGRWTFIDDYTYLRVSRELLTAGHTPLSVFRNPLILLHLDSWSGVQFGYGWWNMLAQYAIGPYYYAPVLLNVAVSCGSAAAVHALALEQRATRAYAGGLMLFYLLHWEILSWSSVLNMKDVLVLALAPAALLLAVRLRQRVTIGRVAGLLAIGAAFLTLRPYSIVLLGGAVIVSSVSSETDGSRRRALRVAATLVLAVLFIAPFVRPLVSLAVYGFSTQVDLSLVAMLRNGIWFLLTPQPWSVGRDHGFLMASSILHLVFLPLALIGGILLWRRGEEIPRLLLYYFLLVLLLNRLAPQSVRHRLQAVFVVAWLQFHVLWVTAHAMVRRSSEPAAGLVRVSRT